MRHLMVSECSRSQCSLEECRLHDDRPFCPSRYSYWGDNDRWSGNFDCPHYTGYTEQEARASSDPEIRYWVAEADASEMACADAEAQG